MCFVSQWINEHCMPVKEQICEQASYTLHHINRVKLFTENSAMARLWDILSGWGSAIPLRHKQTHEFWRKSRELVPQNIVCLHKFNSNHGLQIYTTLYTLDYFIPHKVLKNTCVTWLCDNHINELLHTLRDHQITVICTTKYRQCDYTWSGASG